MLGALLLGGVFGIVAAVAAHARGRSRLAWLIAGMLIGPFALVVALLPAVARSGWTVACPRCAEVVPHQASVCRHCGGLLEAPRARASAGADLPDADFLQRPVRARRASRFGDY